MLACETVDAKLWHSSGHRAGAQEIMNEGGEERGEVKRQTEDKGSRPQQHPDHTMTHDRSCTFPAVPRYRGHTHACVSTPLTRLRASPAA